jgi:hypothetical protein
MADLLSWNVRQMPCVALFYEKGFSSFRTAYRRSGSPGRIGRRGPGGKVLKAFLNQYGGNQTRFFYTPGNLLWVGVNPPAFPRSFLEVYATRWEMAVIFQAQFALGLPVSWSIEGVSALSAAVDRISPRLCLRHALVRVASLTIFSEMRRSHV